MALVGTAAESGVLKTHSSGPVKVEFATYTVGTGITSGTYTASRLHTVLYAVITGVTQTALPTYSGATTTFAFADPGATVFGQIILYGV